ncbi:hypothetical protein [Haladaptatus cibarius]|nr:hypothetical protein [Haladaptatus cibarius]
MSNYCREDWRYDSNQELLVGMDLRPSGAHVPRIPNPASSCSGSRGV